MWTVVGASAIGTRHTSTGGHCQDAHAYQHVGKGTLVVAVADGAGSATHAGIGATTTTAAAVAYLAGVLEHRQRPTETFLRNTFKNVLVHCRAQLQAQADAR